MLEQQGGVIVLAVEEPVRDADGGDVVLLAEKAERGFVALVDTDVELMEMEDAAGIVVDLFKRGHRITLPAEVVKDDETEFGTAVGRVEVDEVNNADSLSLFIINHHPHLTVGVDIIGDMSYIIVEHITGIGHV